MCILPSSNFEQSINALLTLAQFKNYQTCQENEPGFPTCRSMKFTLMVSNLELFEHFNNR